MITSSGKTRQRKVKLIALCFGILTALTFHVTKVEAQTIQSVELSGIPVLYQKDPNIYTPGFNTQPDMDGKVSGQVQDFACLATVYTMISRAYGNPNAVIGSNNYLPESGPGAIRPSVITSISGPQPVNVAQIEAQLNQKIPVILQATVSGLDHYMLVVGVKQSGPNQFTLQVNDPLQPSVSGSNSPNGTVYYNSSNGKISDPNYASMQPNGSIETVALNPSKLASALVQVTTTKNAVSNSAVKSVQSSSNSQSATSTPSILSTSTSTPNTSSQSSANTPTTQTTPAKSQPFGTPANPVVSASPAPTFQQVTTPAVSASTVTVQPALSGSANSTSATQSTGTSSASTNPFYVANPNAFNGTTLGLGTQQQTAPSSLTASAPAASTTTSSTTTKPISAPPPATSATASQIQTLLSQQQSAPSVLVAPPSSVATPPNPAAATSTQTTAAKPVPAPPVVATTPIVTSTSAPTIPGQQTPAQQAAALTAAGLSPAQQAGVLAGTGYTPSNPSLSSYTSPATPIPQTPAATPTSQVSAYTFQTTSYGTVEVFKNGQLVSTTTPQNATLNYGYNAPAAPAPAPIKAATTAPSAAVPVSVITNLTTATKPSSTAAPTSVTTNLTAAPKSSSVAVPASVITTLTPAKPVTSVVPATTKPATTATPAVKTRGLNFEATEVQEGGD